MVQIRYIVVLMGIYSHFTISMLSCNISISAVASQNRKDNDTFFANKKTLSPVAWNDQTIGWILGIYGIGYTLTYIPVGDCLKHLDSFGVIFCSQLIAIIVNIITAVVVDLHVGAVIFCRLIIGLMGGISTVGTRKLLGSWVKSNEPTRFICASIGNTLGVIVTWPLVSVITVHISWRWAFYVISILSSIFLVLFYFFVASSPEKHPHITEKELFYIKQFQDIHFKQGAPPCSRLISNCHIWGIIIGFFGHAWSMSWFITESVNYLSNSYGYGLEISTCLGIIPWFARLIAIFIFEFVGEKLQVPLNKIEVRRIATFLSHILPGIGYFILTYLDNYTVLEMITIVVIMFLHTAIIFGVYPNTKDLSPNYGGAIYSLANVLGMTCRLFVPLLVGYSLQSDYSEELWHVVFYINGIICMICGFIFICFLSIEVVSWNSDSF